MRWCPSRSNYWSCSKFSEKYINSKYDNIVDSVQNVLMFPYDVIDHIRAYCHNRFVTQTHVMNTRLEKGAWHDSDHRMLHGMMELLVDFIEIEKGNMNAWSKDKVDLPFWKRFHILNWSEFRSAKDGLEYLSWEETLTNEEYMDEGDEIILTPQALAATEMKTIYNWWKTIRPNRPDPYKVSGWSDYRKDHNIEDSGSMKMILTIQDMEDKYNNEDEDMLIRLVKIRSGMWT